MYMFLDAAPPLRRSQARRRPHPLAPLLAIGLCMLALLLLASQVYGGGDGPPRSISVEPGQSLWSIVVQRYPGDDVRQRVHQLMVTNHLDSSTLSAGQTLVLPTP